ncbi:hypothetical protein OSB04_007222 [Centaurea solstitialis]|uniref:Transposase-associated domain-containing protein n=1 Tax=Centaurea solstitialis TaxID=347529 RepID=A0AA38U2Q5_9ASTR|nr:hypothetical protein OSB04_007222 [Centaurea solstitialis]
MEATEMKAGGVGTVDREEDAKEVRETTPAGGGGLRRRWWLVAMYVVYEKDKGWNWKAKEISAELTWGDINEEDQQDDENGDRPGDHPDTTKGPSNEDNVQSQVQIQGRTSRTSVPITQTLSGRVSRMPTHLEEYTSREGLLEEEPEANEVLTRVNDPIMYKEATPYMTENVDKTWMNLRRFEEKYILGIYTFLEFAKKNSVSWNGYYKCPCMDCGNMLYENEEDIIYHLKNFGITKTYTVWDQHGEVTNIPTASQQRLNMIRNIASSSHNVNPVVNFVEDAFPFNERYNANESFAEEGTHACDVDDVASKVIDAYSKLLAEMNTPLYEGCIENSLCTLLRAISLKEETGISIKAFDKYLGFQKSLCQLQTSFLNHMQRRKRSSKVLGWEGEMHDQCPVCGLPRYEDVGNKVPMKTVRYFPLTPRLQRLYMSKYTAHHMRWHGQRETSAHDDVLRHPADGEAWKDFDRSYPQFASDIRNVRIGLSTDGFSPFGASATPYSLWPIVVIPYNLPPSMCMQKEFNILTMLISGPKSPGKCLNVFMRPLIDELKVLWETGFRTWD